jgi:hypothetical protein
MSLGEGWLSGWKAIARYINRSIRTAKRYHYQYGMPVRRLPGKRPVALRFELDSWLVKFDELKKEYTSKGT